jgi:DNA-binding SARP family transcriptional activator
MTHELELRLLGPIEVLYRGQRVSLPRSKKTRALLGYLALSERPHSRAKLCELFWDVTDDPRGALRWSLSKLRRVVNQGGEHIEADRTNVSFARDGVLVDALALRDAAKRGLDQASTEELTALADMARGELLEGLELPDFHEFQAWSLGKREQAREARCAVYAELVARLDDAPAEALPHARARVQADPLSVEARAGLLQVLVRLKKDGEAQQQLELACRMFREMTVPGANELQRAWREMTSTKTVSSTTADISPRAPGPASEPFVGREAERARLAELLDACQAEGEQRIALVMGEPGIGKSRLARDLAERARSQGATVLMGRAYEAESSRPYGPWVDALETDLSELIEGRQEDDVGGARDALFAAVAELAGDAADEPGGAVLILDDVQWLDRDSSELLHFVARSNRERRLFLVLLARGGELEDNEHAVRALRGTRRETRVDEIPLGPLSAEEVDALIDAADVDPSAVFQASAGNPLYALELMRAEGADVDATSLVQLVRGRIERLPPSAAELLRWCAVLGHVVDVGRLEFLSSLDLEDLVCALERLEQHALLRVDEADPSRYVFAHDVVREAVYSALSHPRRRLMHQRIARLLDEKRKSPAAATEIAHHASLAGDAMLGVRACIEAGRHSLRVCANGDAESLAKRGLQMVDALGEDASVSSSLELLHIQHSARAPSPERAAPRLSELTERALDLGLTQSARLGFQMLSFMRWETGSMAAAHDNIMQAERLSRSADPEERSIALSQAAKCLVLLERDLNLAESFLLEAGALVRRGIASPSALRFAEGKLMEHRGELEEAAEALRAAREIGREGGDRLAELGALEQLTMLAVDRGDLEAAVRLADELVELSGRVRPGAEAPCARALRALSCERVKDDCEELEEAIAALRIADSKYRLAFVLSRRARLALERGRIDDARGWAEEAIELAQQIKHASELATAQALLARCAEDKASPALIEDLQRALEQGISEAARSRVQAALGALG